MLSARFIFRAVVGFASGLALTAIVAPALAQSVAAYPAKPIRLIVAYPPGGTTDAVARAVAESLSVRLGRQVIVDNKGGAGGTIGMDAVAKAAADGYTLGIAAVSPLTLSPHVGRLPYDAARDIVPVASVMYSPVYWLATPAFDGKSFADVIARSKARPGSIRVATSGIATVGHVMVELIRSWAAIDLTHVPYKGGGQVATDAAGGQFELFTTNPSPAVNALVKAGSLRVLAVGAPRRLASLPDVPTLAELGYAEANLTSTFGIFAPANVSIDIVNRLHAEVARAVAAPDLSGRLQRLDNIPLVMDPWAFAAFIRQESALNARVLMEAGVRP